LKAPIQGLRNREIPAHDVDLWRQAKQIRVATHGAKPRSCCRQLRHNVAADVPGAADDEDAIHERTTLHGERGAWIIRAGRPPGAVFLLNALTADSQIRTALNASAAC
jgi:hypothetical protein